MGLQRGSRGVSRSPRPYETCLDQLPLFTFCVCDIKLLAWFLSTHYLLQEGIAIMSAILPELFRHNLWANLRVFDACSKLSDEQLAAKIPGTYGTISDTLTHICGAEERYVARLMGQPVVRPIREEVGSQELEGWRACVQASGEALVKFTSDTQDSQLVRFTSVQGDEVVIPSSLLLVQAINHATEHRAQILTTLTQQDIEPPDVSGWAWNEDVNG